MKLQATPKCGGPSLIGNRKGGDMLAVTVSAAVTADVRPMIRLAECSVEFSENRIIVGVWDVSRRPPKVAAAA